MPHLPFSIFFLLPLAGYWLVLIYNLGPQWSVYEQYHYGWAVPFLCLYLIWRKVAQASPPARSNGIPAAPTSDLRPLTSPPFHLPSSTSHLPSSIFYLLLALCAFLYLPTRFLHEANPIWRLTSLLWALEVIGLTLLTMHLLHGQMPEIRGQKPHVGGPASIFHLPSSRSLAFPLCFFLVAVPWPSGLENLLTQSLMRLNTSTTVELLGLFGIPAVQHGSVIEVSTGVVGIDEACSGIRSLQATLMISLFLGELYALSAGRRALCVVAGFALAFALNIGRTLLLTRVAAAKGVGAVAAWHDPAGVTILLACFLCLWLLAVWLRKVQSPKSKVQSPASKLDVGCSMLDVGCFPQVPSPAVSPPSEVLSTLRSVAVHPPQCDCPPSAVSLLRRTGYGGRATEEGLRRTGSPAPFSFSVFQRFSILLTAWLFVVEAGTELWYHSHERATAGSAEWSAHRPDQSSTYSEVGIPPGISGQLGYDEGTHGRWQDGSGISWELYYFRWFPAHSLQKRVTIQLAKTHGPETCLPAVGMKESAYLGIITVPVAGTELAMQHYVFNAEGKSLQVFYGIYEDPTGSSKLANRRKDFRSRVAAALAGSRNYGQRFLEVAVVGYERPEEAKAALGRELEKLITVGGVTTGPRDHWPRDH